MRKTKWIVMIVCFLWLAATFCFGAELIPATRTLKGGNMEPGKLFVFSEPPGLVVTLDGKAIGKAPVFLDSVAPGSYQLQVGGQETTVTIAPGKVRRLSFFKGRFIEMPSEEKRASEQPETAETKPAQKPGSEQKPKKSEKLEPGYFPLNPRGPIY